MNSSQPTKMILFDLDNTLFNHNHSLTHALLSIKSHLPLFHPIPLNTLKTAYTTALNQTYPMHLSSHLSSHPTTTTSSTSTTTTPSTYNTHKTALFYILLSLPPPSSQEISIFRTIYKTAYRANRRATPGSLEVLKRLKEEEEGWKIGIVTNGLTIEQKEKADVTGVLGFVDSVTTSEEIGFRKPDRRIFEAAIRLLGGRIHVEGIERADGEVEGKGDGENEQGGNRDRIVFVGDDFENDILGAWGAGLKAVLYEPVDNVIDGDGNADGDRDADYEAEDEVKECQGVIEYRDIASMGLSFDSENGVEESVLPVIRRMDQLLQVLGMTS